MAFGRRGPEAAFSTAGGVRADRSALPRGMSGPIIARRGGYWAGLASGAAGFVGTVACSVAHVVALGGDPRYTPAGLFQFAMVAAGPPIVVGYAISLAVADGVLRMIRLDGRAAYAGLTMTVATLLLSVPTWLANPDKHPTYIFVLVVPGALIGGLVLGGFRRRGDVG